MRTAYQITPTGLLGSIISVEPMASVPMGFTFKSPDNYDPTKRYQWIGNGWQEVTDLTPFIERQKQIDLKNFGKAKQAKLEELGNAFISAEQNGVITSSAGFDIDANDRANRDLDGLATSMETAGTQTVMFCAADNTFHEVTLAQVKTMRLELIAHAQALYARKWQLRAAIEAATTTEELEAIVIDFSDVDSPVEGAE